MDLSKVELSHSPIKNNSEGNPDLFKVQKLTYFNNHVCTKFIIIIIIIIYYY